MDNQEQNDVSKIPGIDDDLPELPVVDELTALKSKADLMSLTFHPSIGVDKLRDKVRAAIEAEGKPVQDEDEVEETPTPPPVLADPVVAVPVQAYQAPALDPVVVQKKEVKVKYASPKAHAEEVSQPVEGETLPQARMRMKRHANELIRIGITCQNPAKKEWDGEIVSVGNNLVGTLKKYVPFGAEDGWHVPRIMYNVLRDRMCTVFITVTDPATKQKVRKGKQIKEFIIEVLEPLTAEELAELAARQAATRAID